MISPQSLPKPKKPKLLLLRRVMGDSMAPTLPRGSVVVGVPSKRIKVGDVVLVHHEGMDKVKRVKDLQQNKVLLIGDNLAQSTDGRDFGWLVADSIIAKVIWPRTNL